MTATAPAKTAAASATVAPLEFIRPSGEGKPTFLSAALTGGAPKVLFETQMLPAEIQDMRPLKPTLSVDREGFQLIDDASTVVDFYDDDEIVRVYHPEVEALVKRVLGASRVVVFDTTRRADNTKGAANPDGLRGPAGRVHVDYTVGSGPVRLADVIGAYEAKRLLDGGVRVAQINVWRPIVGPVRRSPLALADASSVAPEDLIATDQVFPDRTGEIYHLAPAAAQRWYYAPLMTPDEALLIKGWDTDPAPSSPHSSSGSNRTL
ncbi:MAG: CmcJ/NvfI family oxidoreductase [Rhodospirillaceae bacterium]